MTLDFEVIADKVADQQGADELLERLFEVADVGSVYGEPVTAGEYTLITASELKVNLGYGFGLSGGSGGSKEGEEGGPGRASGSGFGSGGGGGGAAAGRPVAAIELGPNGVRVEPIIDPTKIAVAFFTTLLGMFGMMARARRRSKRL